MLLTVTTLCSFVSGEKKRAEQLKIDIVVDEKRIKDMAYATLDLVEKLKKDGGLKIEESLAYQMAQHFIRKQNGNSR